MSRYRHAWAWVTQQLRLSLGYAWLHLGYASITPEPGVTLQPGRHAISKWNEVSNDRTKNTSKLPYANLPSERVYCSPRSDVIRTRRSIQLWCCLVNLEVAASKQTQVLITPLHYNRYDEKCKTLSYNTVHCTASGKSLRRNSQQILIILFANRNSTSTPKVFMSVCRHQNVPCCLATSLRIIAGSENARSGLVLVLLFTKLIKTEEKHRQTSELHLSSWSDSATKSNWRWKT